MKKYLIFVIGLAFLGLSSCSDPARDVRKSINQEIQKLLPKIRERYKVYQEIAKNAKTQANKLKNSLRIGKRPRFRRLSRLLVQKHKYQYHHAANPMFAYVAMGDLNDPDHLQHHPELRYIRLSVKPWFESPDRFVKSMNKIMTRHFRKKVFKKSLFMEILRDRYFRYMMPRYLFVLRTHRLRHASLMITRNPQKVITAHHFKPGIFSGDLLMYDLLDRKLIGTIRIEARSIQALNPDKLESYNSAWFRNELRQKVHRQVNSFLGDILH